MLAKISKKVLRHPFYAFYFRQISTDIILFRRSSRTLNISDVIDNTSSINQLHNEKVENPNENFYGIEGDEGVINVTKQSKLRASNSDNVMSNEKRNAEKLKATAFGYVRFDNDNRPLFHGQFEQSIFAPDGSDFPGDEMKNVLKENIKAPIFINPLNTNENTSYIPPREFKKSPKVENSTLQETTHSFFDEVCFTDILNKQDENKSVEANYSDFENIVKDNYIEDQYFGQPSLSDNSKICDDFQVKQGIQNVMADFPIDYDSINYKGKETPLNELSFPDSKSSKNLSVAQEVSNPDVNDFPTFIDNQYFNQSLQSDNYEDFTRASNIKKNRNLHVSNEITESNTDYEKVSAPSNVSSQNEHIHSFIQKEVNHKLPSKNKELSKQKSNLKQIQEGKNTFDKIERKSIISEKRISLKDKDISKETSNKNYIEVDATIKLKEGTASKEQQCETAFDFVSKIREEEKLTHHKTRGGYFKPEEKLDSKGFRILKNQVPELKFFTRDEILDLLSQSVLYEDSDIVVLNKPYNLVMHESKTTKDACLSAYLDDLASILDKHNEHPKLFTVHRLDKETTGCLLLARNETAAQYLKSLFAERKIIKTYWIATIRVPEHNEGVIDIPISEGTINNKVRMVLHPKLPGELLYRNHSKTGKRAVTRYKVIATSGNAALVEVKPETGLKHQIRVHFGLGLGCPILGDHKYSYTDKLVPQKLSSDILQRLRVRQSKVRHIPMHMYARSVFLPDRRLYVSAPMPPHMAKNLRRLKFRKP